MSAAYFPAFPCVDLLGAALEDFGRKSAVGFAVVDGIVKHHAQFLVRVVANHELVADFFADADRASVQFQ